VNWKRLICYVRGHDWSNPELNRSVWACRRCLMREARVRVEFLEGGGVVAHIDPRDWGAKGDGWHDDSEAIEESFAAARAVLESYGGGTVNLAPGEYRL
jgi:hypothetical protein